MRLIRVIGVENSQQTPQQLVIITMLHFKNC